MRYDSDHQHRRSTRLAGYDYARQAAYFITICTKQRSCLFGEIVEGRMRLNPSGSFIVRQWQKIPSHFPSGNYSPCLVENSDCAHRQIQDVGRIGISTGLAE